jgi:hypothetical protein
MRPKKRRKATPVPYRATLKLLRQYAKNGELRKLKPEDLYCLELTGHIQNEISWLQRAAYISSKEKIGKDFHTVAGQVMQTGIILRILIGKVNEVQVVLEKNKKVRAFLEQWYDVTNNGSGAALINEIEQAFEDNVWIRTGRNKHFLHYPSFNDVAEAMSTDGFQFELEIFHAEKMANTVYASADAFFNLAWFRLVDADPFAGFGAALDTVIGITKQLQELMHSATINFIRLNLATEESTHYTTAKYALDKFEFPFYLDMPN